MDNEHSVYKRPLMSRFIPKVNSKFETEIIHMNIKGKGWDFIKGPFCFWL